MKYIITLLSISTLLFSSYTAGERLISKNGHIHFYSHTAVEDISADNYTITSSLNTENGEVVYSVPMQGFEFENSTMQKHYNSKKFLNTKKYPKAKFKGKIVDLSKVDFSTNGTYQVQVQGEMTIKGISKPVTESGSITVSDSEIESTSKMNLTLSDYEISFAKGKPSTNIAKTIEVTAHVVYKKQ